MILSSLQVDSASGFGHKGHSMAGSTYKRWYDRNPKLSMAVRLMLILPDEIKSILAEGTMIIANREFKISEKENSFRTLGPEKVMGIYKSKNKRREYDHNPTLHKAMNYLYIMSEGNQDYMASHIVALVGFIQYYLSTCQAFEAEPSLEDVATITKLYIDMGKIEVEDFLGKLRQEFHNRLMEGLTTPDPPPVDFLDTAQVQETDGGMQIRSLETS